MRIAVIGATGMVGKKMLQVLEERNFPVKELILAASVKSIGKELPFGGRLHKVIGVMEAVEKKPQIALFSAGGGTSLEWAPAFASVGSVVIDNSSAWRMEENIPLVVPEINSSSIKKGDKIIANPNCSTIQLVMALAPLHKRYGIKRVVVSTYQSITGTGVKAVSQMENERSGIKGQMAYPHPIDLNCIPQCDTFLDNGYTKEEVKVVNETRKILSAPSIQITATAVRVPVTGGHSESVNVEFDNEYDLAEVKRLLASFPGVVVQDDPSKSIYPMPLTSHDRDEVFVGRIRRDFSNPRTLNMWITSDNIRKGAATNAVQIAEYMVSAGLI